LGRQALDRRFMRATIYRVEPGATADFVEHRRTIRAAQERAGVRHPIGVYQVSAESTRNANESFTSVETQYFAISPSMSHVAQEVVAMDRAFWGPRMAARPELTRNRPAPRP